MADAPKLLGTDTLRIAYPKVNMAIDNANAALRNSEDAVAMAGQALQNSESTQTQLDNIIIENGQSDAEVVQARTKADGTTFPVLRDRLNDVDDKIGILNEQLAENVSKLEQIYADRVIHLTDFGGKGDRKSITVTTIESSPIITAAEAVFKPDDAGKLMYIPGAGPGGNTLITFISEVNSPTQVTLTGNAYISVSGVTGYFGTDNKNAFALANAEVLKTPNLKTVIELPAGDIMLTAPCVPNNNTIFKGQGMDITTIYPVGTIHAFYRIPSETPNPSADPVFNVHWRDLTVDGSVQTGQQKGWYLNHMKQCSWVRCKCANTGASGFGVDYLQDCWFIDCIADGNGRLGTISSPGFSGFGIGTGAWKNENVYFVNCIARNNKRFGLFVENQDTMTQSFGAQVVGGLYERNRWGISDNGTDSLIVNGAHIVNNIADGFILTTTAAIEQVGVRGLLTNCIITGNGGDGVQFDFTQDDIITWGKYRVINNIIENNTGYGIRVRIADGKTLSQMIFEHNIIRENGLAGIGLFAGTGGILKDSIIARNTIIDNGVSGSNRRGIMVSCDLVDVNIDDNRIGDTRETENKTQQHGIWFSLSAPTITMTGGRIVNNDLRGNSVAAFANLSQMSLTTAFRDNDGYSLGPDALTLSGSPHTHTVGHMREVLYIDKGNFNSIKIDGIQVFTGQNDSIIPLILFPRQVVVFDYISSPISIKRFRF